MVSLRKTLFTVFFFCILAALLTLVVVLGLLQYRFTHEYDTIIYQGEKILFRFDTLQEHLTRSMLSGNVQNIKDATARIDTLNTDLTRLLENSLVPSEYKLALINQVDIPRIAVLAIEVTENPEDSKIALQLHDQLRVLADNLMQFDRVLTGQMRTRLIRFQGLAIGALTFIIASVSLLVLFLYQKALVPLISLAQHLQQPNLRDPIQVDSKSCREIAELTEHINLMIIEGAYAASRSDESSGRYSLSPQELNKINNHLTGIINYTQLLIDEGQQDGDEESLEMLAKVRENGERMGSILQKKTGGKKDDG
jgi:hypothetical protein